MPVEKSKSKKDDSAFTLGSDGVMPMGALVDETSPDSADEGDVGIPRMTASRILRVALSADGGGSIAKAEDAAHASGDLGIMLLAVRQDTAAALAGTDGDYIPVIVDANGRLHVSLSAVLNSNNNALRSQIEAGNEAIADGDTSHYHPVFVGGSYIKFPARGWRYNNVSWDMERNNYEETVLASAARTASVDSADLVNYNARGVVVVVDVTAITATPSITVTIQGKSTLGSDYYTILASAAITGTGQTVLRVYPGLLAVANSVVNDVIPRLWRVSVAAGDADSITYSVSANYIL